jgi:hypothetical protein
MEKVISCCAGLDVSKESIEACVRRIEPDGRLHQKTQHWPTMINSLQKVLEEANIKLSAVAADTLGVSRRAMIQRLIEGDTDPHKLADLALGQLRGKIPELEKALRGRVTEHNQFLLSMLWQQLVQQEAWIARNSYRIAVPALGRTPG